MPAFALTALRHWKLVGIGLLALLLVVQTVRLSHRSNQLERAKIANNELRAELKAISDAKNKQAEITKGNIRKIGDERRKVEDIAKRIERAPTAPNCETPPEIMGADI